MCRGWGRDSGERDVLLLSVLRDVMLIGGHVELWATAIMTGAGGGGGGGGAAGRERKRFRGSLANIDFNLQRPLLFHFYRVIGMHMGW